MPRIDAHAHVIGDHPRTVALLQQLDVKVINIGVAETNGRPWRDYLAAYRRLAAQHPGRFAWVAAVELPNFQEPDYAGRAIAQLDRDFAAGALGAKVWKNIGMEIRKPDGSPLMIDDPIFEPVFAHLEKQGRPLLMHIAEPLACWLPPVEGDPHSAYYVRNPQWHMYGRADVPSHADLMAARDHVVQRHPGLRVIGAHLGSMEYDLNEIAARFDRYPNFAVDTAGRTRDLAYYADAESARAFLTRYVDRVLWATDMVRFTPHSTFTDEKREDDLGHIRREYDAEFAFYEAADTGPLGNRQVQRLNLSPAVCRKLFFDNARAWYPGL